MEKLLLLTAILITTQLHADTLKGGGYGACVSAELFKQFTSAVSKKDERLFQYLLKNGCIMTKPGTPISIIDKSWTTARVRAYSGSGSIELWTAAENIQK